MDWDADFFMSEIFLILGSQARINAVIAKE